MIRVDEQRAARVVFPDPDHPPPGRRRRRRGWVLLVPAAVLAAAVVGVGLAGWPTGHRPGASARPTGSGQTPPGSCTVAGVRVGYQHTPAGAEAAATNYVVAYGSAAMFHTAARHAILTAIADPSVLPVLQHRLDVTFAAVMATFGLGPNGSPPAGQTFVARTVPVGVRLVGYTATAARVAVWSTGLIGLTGPGSTKPVAEAWSTATLSLRWTGGDWKWVSFTQIDGPTPVSGLQPASGATAIAAAVHTFGEPRYGR